MSNVEPFVPVVGHFPNNAYLFIQTCLYMKLDQKKAQLFEKKTFLFFSRFQKHHCTEPQR